MQAISQDRPSHPGPASGPDSGLTVFDLDRVEQLLVWSARRWRYGRFGWVQVEAEFRRLAGTGWADALLAWEQALDLMHRYPLTQPEIPNGCAPRISRDERALLTFVALVQRRMPAEPTLLLNRLAVPALRKELGQSLRELAWALLDQPLPLRQPPPPPPPAGGTPSDGAPTEGVVSGTWGRLRRSPAR